MVFYCPIVVKGGTPTFGIICPNFEQDGTMKCSFITHPQFAALPTGGNPTVRPSDEVIFGRGNA